MTFDEFFTQETQGMFSSVGDPITELNEYQKNMFMNFESGWINAIYIYPRQSGKSTFIRIYHKFFSNTKKRTITMYDEACYSLLRFKVHFKTPFIGISSMNTGAKDLPPLIDPFVRININADKKSRYGQLIEYGSNYEIIENIIKSNNIDAWCNEQHPYVLYFATEEDQKEFNILYKLYT